MSRESRITPAQLRGAGEELASILPPLLAEARQLAATIRHGVHGRRRAGTGEEFWQYRSAGFGDSPRDIDWRRSARGDAHFVRQKEWQTAQAVYFWIDDAQSMRYHSAQNLPTKGARAAVLGLALAILLARGDERVGLTRDPRPLKSGEGAIRDMVLELTRDQDTAEEYGLPVNRVMQQGARAVFISDFLGDWEGLRASLARAADQNVQGVLIQVLDPAEESLPFDGRTIFQSMGAGLELETQRARSLRAGYKARLAERKEALKEAALQTGWRYFCHHNSDPAPAALLWAYTALRGDA